MRTHILNLILLCGVSLTAAAMEPVKEQPVDDRPAQPAVFDHGEHIGLKVPCDTCHTTMGSPQLRDNACAECHDDGTLEESSATKK